MIKLERILVLVLAFFMIVWVCRVGCVILSTMNSLVSSSLVIEVTEEHILGSTFIEPGGSLWKVAREYYSGYDSRRVVHALRVVNGMKDSVSVFPGDKIFLPDMRLF